MYATIVVGTDGSATARGAVAEAARLARTFEATLHIVSAYQPPNVTVAAATLAGEGIGIPAEWDVAARDVVVQSVEQAASAARAEGTKVDTYVVAGAPANAILSVAETASADLIVVGNRGMAGARRVLGSVPNSVAHKASCAVLIVKTC